MKTLLEIFYPQTKTHNKTGSKMYKVITTYKTPAGNHTVENFYKSKPMANLSLGGRRNDPDVIKSELIKVEK